MARTDPGGEVGAPTMFARVGVMWALNRDVGRVFDPSSKDHMGPSGSWRVTTPRPIYPHSG
jgi:hypothetical protein